MNGEQPEDVTPATPEVDPAHDITRPSEPSPFGDPALAAEQAAPLRAVPRPAARKAPLSDEEPPTERRGAAAEIDPGEGPPEINRFLSPPPPPPRAETASGSDGATRRRSRRTVKIPDDVPGKARPVDASPAPPPVLASPPPAPVAEKPVLPAIPPTPPVPTLGVRPVPRPTLRSSTEEAAAAKPAEEPRPDPILEQGPPPLESFEIIRPMRIINIGTTEPPPPPAAADAEPGWDAAILQSPSRPPMPAATELELFSAAPAPKPPAVEEVEAIADEDEPPPPVAALRAEEIESIPDDEVLPDRVSDHGATHDEIPVDEVEVTPAAPSEPPPPPKSDATKKPPPPPPKRAAETPVSSPVPPVTRPDGAAALAALPATAPMASAQAPAPMAAAQAPASAQAPEPVVAPPPPPPAVERPSSPLAQTVDLSPGRRRQKPWWEELFSDDYLRTMEKIEPKAIRKECDFIEDRLGLEKGAVMLDLACGAGLHAVELSSRGYNVVGYDLSLAMLARAQDEAIERGQKINFLQGDMREMAFEEAFDGIYSWNTSFGYFEDEKNVEVLSRIRRGLRQGGLFLLDVANRDYICPRQPSLVWFEGDGCVCMDEMHVDFFSSRLRVKRTVMFEDGRSREVDYGIRMYALHELGKMLHETGFRVIEVTGHPAHPGVFFGSESPRVIVLAERA
jgi:SAM-dependent methyltransferase